MNFIRWVTIKSKSCRADIQTEDSVGVVFLAPEAPTDDANNRSAVLRITYGDFAAGLMGDAEAPEEAILLSKSTGLKAQVLKVGHHGSATSTTAALLERVKPSVAIVSVGAGNQYGHPDRGILDRLASGGAAIYRTDKTGTIVIQTDGKTYSAGKRQLPKVSRLILFTGVLLLCS